LRSSRYITCESNTCLLMQQVPSLVLRRTRSHVSQQETSVPRQNAAARSFCARIVACTICYSPGIRVCQIVRPMYVYDCTCRPGLATCAIPSAISNIRKMRHQRFIVSLAFPFAILPSKLVLVPRV